MSSARRYAALSIRIHSVSTMSPRVDDPQRDQKRQQITKDSTSGWRARRLMAARDIVTEELEKTPSTCMSPPPTECSCEGRSFPPPPSNLCRLGAWAVHAIAERQEQPSACQDPLTMAGILLRWCWKVGTTTIPPSLSLRCTVVMRARLRVE
ncbi:hypothetical protein CSHISOI_00354 [Colletotrichum shisoi]|uniref:Uncharacterized protein n=1 Tax=Colletotrichum shisoi TaxID=2078593 RepID=A0A5Q4C6X9_9PEZI|nr:hypothetical protein CSHISOI_00354 [Colletotrichum shisoi]